MSDKAYPENSIKVPENRMQDLDARIKKLNRTADKLGVAPVGYDIIDEVEEWVNTMPHELATVESWIGVAPENNPWMIREKFFVVVATGEAPVLAGWKLLARLEHVDDMNLLYPVPGEEVPPMYRTRSKQCDHCEKKRLRKDTFVVQNVETGETKQVGSNCLRDFLGHNSPEYVVRLAAWYTQKELLGCYDDGIGDVDYDEEAAFMKGRLTIDSEKFLSIVALLVELEGWVSRSTAGFGGSTCDNALSLYFPPYKGTSEKERNRVREILSQLKPEHKSTARQALKWMANDMPTKSDYQWNLHAAAVQGKTTRKNCGILASGIVAFAKHTEWELKRKFEAKTKSNEWVAEQGERKKFEELTLVRMRWIETMYGESTLFSFEDPKGNAINWFSSNPWFKTDDNGEVKPHVGAKVTLTGRVKKLDTYKERKQTVLTRCRVHTYSHPEGNCMCGGKSDHDNICEECGKLKIEVIEEVNSN